MLKAAKRHRWATKPLFSVLVVLVVCGVVPAAGAEGADEGRHRQRWNENNASLGLTEQQQADLAKARRAAFEATKEIEDPEERGKAICALMVEARNTILNEEQKAQLEKLGENHQGPGKGTPGPGGAGHGKGTPGPGGEGHGKGTPGPGGAGHGKGTPGPGGQGHGKGT
jgi:hypothetical protein